MVVEKLDTKDAFESALKNAGEKLVVVDFFATWCGPCRVIAPKIEEFSETYTDVLFYKVDVDDNDETAEKQGVSAMPSFFLYKKGQKVGELVGANAQKLEELIKNNK